MLKLNSSLFETYLLFGCNEHIYLVLLKVYYVKGDYFVMLVLWIIQ